MAKINRSDVIQKAVNELSFSTSSDKIPTETLDKVQLTYNLNKQYSNFIVSLNRATTGTVSLTMPVIDTRSEIYLTSLDFDIIKDATCDVPTGEIDITLTPFEQGISKTIVAVSILTLTAQQQHIHCDFTYPIRLKPNTVIITSLNTYSAGLMSRTISVTGFTTTSN